MNKPLRAGVIGVGSMGKNHARIYHELQETELVGLADIRNDLVHQIAEQYNVKAFSDYHQLLALDLDLVSIVVPTSLHKEVALAAADSGVNVLVEKPIANTLESANAIVTRCAQKGIKLMVGQVERFNPVFSVIKNQIQNLNVISINIMRLGPLPPRIKDVGVVIDLATHDIDILRFLTGFEFRKVYSLTARSLADKFEDTALISLETENGILCHINTNWLTPFKVREVNIAAKEKYIKGWLMEQKVSEFESVADGGYVVKDLPVPYGEPLKLELQAFVKAVANDVPPPVTGDDGLKVLEVALRCLEATK